MTTKDKLLAIKTRMTAREISIYTEVPRDTVLSWTKTGKKARNPNKVNTAVIEGLYNLLKPCLDVFEGMG